MIRLVSSILALLVVGYAAYWASSNGKLTRGFFEKHMDTGEFLTLEARYTPEEIMEAQASRLLKDESHSYRRSNLQFFPYILMEVKYSRNDRKTAEGMILWSLSDGEMVLNTDTWDTTHGFEDCLVADAGPSDFRVINALAANGGAMDRDQLVRALHIDEETLLSWLDSVKRKHLVVQRGNVYRLHFANPKLQVTPQTKFTQWLVTKPYKHASRLGAKYSKGQIRRLAESAFGQDFAIRTEQEVYLPVYSIVVENPDGSVLTSFWNAMTGQPLKSANIPR